MSAELIQHNIDPTSHPLILQKLDEKADSMHSHGISDITGFADEVITTVSDKLIDDINYPINTNTKIVTHSLLEEQLIKIAEKLAQKDHTHLKSGILDFEHNHDNLYYQTNILNSLDKDKGAALIGASIEELSGTNVLEILESLKIYSTNNIVNFTVKQPVRVVSVSHITSLKGIQHTIDNIDNFHAGDRVLLAGQFDKKDNGIWIIQSDDWIRPKDFKKTNTLADFLLTFILEGEENLHTGWLIESQTPNLGGMPQPHELGKTGFFCTPFSYNRNVKSSNTIEIKTDTISNVLIPSLRVILNNLPLEATFGRVKVDEYGRVIDGDLLGKDGRDLLLEDYNIVDAASIPQVETMIEEAITDVTGDTSHKLDQLEDELKDYTDTKISTHDGNVNAHENLKNKIIKEVHDSTAPFAHIHDGRYYTETELGSNTSTSGAELIGVKTIEGISATHTNVQEALKVLKDYTDTIAQSLDIKESVYVATTNNITLSGLQTIDGITLIENERVLVKDQIDAKTNGLYDCKIGAWVRSKDSIQGKLTSGAFAFVEYGALNESTGWVLGTKNPITLGTTPLNFIQFSSAGIITAGAGLNKNGNEIYMPEILSVNKEYTVSRVNKLGKVYDGFKPTDIIELGITNVYTKNDIDTIIEQQPTATELKKGLMSKEDKIKLNDLEAGAEVNQNAFSHVKIGSNTLSADEKTDIIIIKPKNGIKGQVDATGITLELDAHKHVKADITDFPASMPADGGNADTVDNYHAKDFVLHEEWVGTGNVGGAIHPEIASGISIHNADPTAHQFILNELNKKVELFNGKIKPEFIPIELQIDQKDIAIIGNNGNWWTYDIATLGYIDTGVKAQGPQGEPVTVNGKSADSNGNIQLLPEDIGDFSFEPKNPLTTVELPEDNLFICQMFVEYGAYGLGPAGDVPAGGSPLNSKLVEFIFDENRLTPVVADTFKAFIDVKKIDEKTYQYNSIINTEERTLILKIGSAM